MQNDMSEMEKTQIGYEILAYLAEHPKSRDTLEGIAEWWLLEQQIKTGINQVKEALTGLVAGGWLIQLDCIDSNVQYSINDKKYEEIQELFKNRKGE